jgi:hypothetical protein
VIHPGTLEVVDELRISERDVLSGTNPLTDICGGTYFFLDAHYHAFATTTDSTIAEVAVAGDGTLTRVRDWPMASYLPDGDCLVATGVGWDGRLWWFSQQGVVGTLDRATGTVQVKRLPEGEGIAINKKLIFFGAAYYYRGHYGQVMSNQKVGVYLDIENKEANHLGIPLPKGVVRVYKADKSGAKQFIGEDLIDHTPRDEKIRIKMGEAFDIVADKKQMDWKPFGSCVSESAWEIKLKNHKDKAEEIEVVEPVGGDWEILSSTLPATKKDQWTFTFSPKVPAKGEVIVKYRVRIRWC